MSKKAAKICKRAVVIVPNLHLDLLYFCFSVTSEAAEGLKYYDVVEGKGPIAEKGSTIQVWF